MKIAIAGTTMPLIAALLWGAISGFAPVAGKDCPNAGGPSAIASRGRGDDPGRSPRRLAAQEEPVSVAPDVTSDRGRQGDRLEALLRDIDEVDRQTRLDRWEEIFALAEEPSSDVAFRLRRLAAGDAPEAGSYQRFVAAANVSGFGMPSRLGPNALNDMSLALYIVIQRSIRKPDTKRRYLRLHPDLEEMRVTIAPAPDEEPDLAFQEILWRIIEQYELDFRTENDGTFVLIPGAPSA